MSGKSISETPETQSQSLWPPPAPTSHSTSPGRPAAEMFSVLRRSAAHAGRALATAAVAYSGVALACCDGDGAAARGIALSADPSAAYKPLPLPELPYEYDALEPHMDGATMRVHSLGHHATYTGKLNEALAALWASPNTRWAAWALEDPAWAPCVSVACA